MTRNENITQYINVFRLRESLRYSAKLRLLTGDNISPGDWREFLCEYTVRYNYDFICRLADYL